MQHLDNFLRRLRGVKRQGSGWRACCPLHADREASMSISLGEGNRIIFRCHVCGNKRATDMLSAMGLKWRDTYAKGADVKKRYLPQVERAKATSNPEDMLLRNQAYSYLAGNVPLTKEHEEELERRGLDRAHIHSDGYFSVELVSSTDVGRLLIDLGEPLYDIPGFWSDVAGRPRFAGGSGLFIPVRNERRQIVSGQIRTGGDPKYVWLRGSGCPAHIPLCVEPADDIWITEGPLKADVSALLSGFPVIGIGGVTAWRGLLPALERWDTARVVVAFDADWQQKAEVREQLEQFIRHLLRKGFQVDLAEWSLSQGKGLDDLLVAGFNPKIREVKHADQFAGQACSFSRLS